MAASESMICEQDGLVMVPNASKSEWICSNGHRHFTVTLKEELNFKSGFGLLSTSSEIIDGLPIRQEEDYTCDVREGHTIIERNAKSKIITLRISGSDYATNDVEERETGKIFIGEYNLRRSTTFPLPTKSSEDALYDLVTTEPSTGNQLLLQVRRADSRPWKNLSHECSYKIQEEEQASLTELWNGVENKKSHYSKDDCAKMILLLDGYPAMLPSSLIHFKAEYYARLQDAGFQEIWYMVRPPIQSATCLYP